MDAGRLVGNFPQAFTHLTLVDAALTLDEGWCRRAGRPGADETRPGATEPPLTACVRSRDDRRRAPRPRRHRAASAAGGPRCTPTSSAISTTSSGRTPAGSAGSRTGGSSSSRSSTTSPTRRCCWRSRRSRSRGWSTCCGRSPPSLPGRLYAHLSPGLVDALAPVLVPSAEPVPHCKLGLVDPTALERHDTDEAELLAPSHLAEIEAFYGRAYPGTWFQPRMLETGSYVGIRRDGELACVAGIHVWSPTWGVAALGNVATAAGAPGDGSRDRGVRAPLPRAARRRDRRDLAQRPRRQRRGDPRVREARLRPRGRLRRGDALGARRERGAAVICIVGAGAAGLASAATLRRAGAEVVVLERDDVGAAWQARYDCLHLHTMRWLSGLPGYGIPRSYGKWPSRDRVVDYLRAYASRHSLDVRTGGAVRRIDRDGSGWVVTVDGEASGRSASWSRPGTATFPTCPTGRGRSPASSCTRRTTAAATRIAACGSSSSERATRERRSRSTSRARARAKCTSRCEHRPPSSDATRSAFRASCSGSRARSSRPARSTGSRQRFAASPSGTSIRSGFPRRRSRTRSSSAAG